MLWSHFFILCYSHLKYANIFQYDYVHDHEKSKAKNHFDVTDTPVYSQIKDHTQQTNDVSVLYLVYS